MKESKVVQRSLGGHGTVFVFPGVGRSLSAFIANTSFGSDADCDGALSMNCISFWGHSRVGENVSAIKPNTNFCRRTGEESTHCNDDTLPFAVAGEPSKHNLRRTWYSSMPTSGVRRAYKEREVARLQLRWSPLRTLAPRRRRSATTRGSGQ